MTDGRPMRYPSHVISYADHGCLTLPRPWSRPRPGRFISVMAWARAPGAFRDSGADRPQGRWCGVRASRRAMRQSEWLHRETCDPHVRLRTLRRCCRQAVYSCDLAHLAGTVAGDRAGVRRHPRNMVRTRSIREKDLGSNFSMKENPKWAHRQSGGLMRPVMECGSPPANYWLRCGQSRQMGQFV